MSAHCTPRARVRGEGTTPLLLSAGNRFERVREEEGTASRGKSVGRLGLTRWGLWRRLAPWPVGLGADEIRKEKSRQKETRREKKTREEKRRG